jgi:hypothetical protein
MIRWPSSEIAEGEQRQQTKAERAGDPNALDPSKPDSFSERMLGGQASSILAQGSISGKLSGTQVARGALLGSP